MEASGLMTDRARSDDEIAIERYRYLLRTAPPETIEESHAEAFARLSPDQRRQVIDGLVADVPEAAGVSPEDPRGMARMATRAELRQPGILERNFGSTGGGFGLGGWFLTTMAASFIGTAAAQAFFSSADSGDVAPEGHEGGGSASDASVGDSAWDGGGSDGGDFGGGFGGGGDFGGGDFGI
ncbi:MAG: hypothetical protein H0X20_01080 [Chloroflexi bacterium]|nr:hypothetical protein [Chloroflexota bacterium]